MVVLEWVNVTLYRGYDRKQLSLGLQSCGRNASYWVEEIHYSMGNPRCIVNNHKAVYVFSTCDSTGKIEIGTDAPLPMWNF